MMRKQWPESGVTGKKKLVSCTDLSQLVRSKKKYFNAKRISSRFRPVSLTKNRMLNVTFLLIRFVSFSNTTKIHTVILMMPLNARDVSIAFKSWVQRRVWSIQGRPPLTLVLGTTTVICSWIKFTIMFCGSKPSRPGQLHTASKTNHTTKSNS